MSDHFILIQIDGKNITVNPTRLVVGRDTGNQKITWIPGSGVQISEILFDEEPAPIDPQPDAGRTWSGAFNTKFPEGCYKYTVTVDGLEPLDPEIENAPGTVEPEEPGDGDY